MADVTAELKRQPEGGGSPVAWELANDTESSTTRADPVIDAGARARLDSVKTKLDAIKDAIDAVGTNTDGIEAFLSTIRDNADQVESLLTALGTNTDGVETLLTALQTLLTSIRDQTDQLEGYSDGVETLLTAVRDNADQVETLLGGLLLETTFKKRFGVSTGAPVVASASGTNDCHTPAAGKAIRLKWIGLVTPKSNTAEVIVTVLLGATEIYKLPMQNPFAFAHGTVREGAVDEKLRVNLSAAQSVYVNYDVEEF